MGVSVNIVNIVNLSLLSRKDKNLVKQVLVSYKQHEINDIGKVLIDIDKQLSAVSERSGNGKDRRKDNSRCEKCGRKKMRLRCGAMICPVC